MYRSRQIPEMLDLEALEVKALQVIGTGVAGIGIMVAADRLGMTDRLLESGLIFFERSQHENFSSLAYDIESNSSGAEFVSEIHPHGIYAQILQTPEARIIANATDKRVSLRQVSYFMERLTCRFKDYAQQHYAISPIRYGVTVRRLMILRDGSFVSFDNQGRPLARSQNTVLAVGGEQILDSQSCPHTTDGDRPILIGADEFLRGQQDAVCAQVLFSGGRIMLLGGSHSGWSVVERLLHISEGPLKPGQILISARRPTTLYFPSVRHAIAAGMPPRAHQICPETGQVNRFDGLRGRAQAMYLRYASGELPMLEKKHGPIDKGWRIDNLKLVIMATGYRPRHIELYDHRGIPITTEVEFGNIKLDSKGCVMSWDHGKIPNLFGLGLGHAIRRYGTFRIGVNIFHGEAASCILKNITGVR